MKKDTEIKATVMFTENGLSCQKTFTAVNEEELFKSVFWFQVEYFHIIQVTQVAYHGKNINWDRASTYAHYWLGENKMSFEEFKEACFNETEKVAS